MTDRRATNVHLVEDRLVERNAWWRIAFPVERGIDDDANRRRACIAFVATEIVAAAHVVGESTCIPFDGAIERESVGVQQENVRIEAEAAFGFPRAADAKPITLIGTKA